MKFIIYITVILSTLIFIYAACIKLNLIKFFPFTGIPTPGTLLDTSGVLLLFSISLTLISILNKLK